MRVKLCRSWNFLIALPVLLSMQAQVGLSASKSDLTTKAERSQWVETGRYEEVERLCKAYQKTYPEKVKCFTFGTTAEGRPMLALAIGEKSYLLPSREKSRKRPVVLFQGGIHAGEIDGKDAGFWFIRDMLDGKILPDALKKVTLVFVPVFNVDGHERFGANNRPNQIGPKEMGWRTTAQNYNINRDYMKADAPETKAMITLLRSWDPLAYVDLHVTDGAKFQHDIALVIEPSLSGSMALRSVAEGLRGKAMADLKADGSLPLPYYPSFVTDDDPSSGISPKPASVRFSNGYWALSNRIGVLVETHSWKPYAHRVKSTYDALKTVIASAVISGADWRKASDAADAETAALIGKDLALSYKSTNKSTPIEFLGYAYTRKPSAVSGQLMTRYDDEKPEVWKIPFFPEVETKVEARVPKSFVIPSAYRNLFEERLKLHGIRYEILKTPWKAKAEAFRTKIISAGKGPNESHQRMEYEGAWEPVEGEELAGSLRVDLDQPQAKLAMLLLDPTSADSLLAWGYMNQIFERKEYMEAYVAEEVAETMLKVPTIKAEFDEKLKDPDFVKDPEKRLDFFAQRHQSFDRKYLMYPVLRIL
ncbi:MAG: peptidase M14 [Proteobacteria bacterium]|nr:MAG: peptidase M14 [Pseudomonadota bacterium]